MWGLRGRGLAFASLVMAAGLIYLLAHLPTGAGRSATGDSARGPRELLVYCAAGIKPAIAEAAAAYAEESCGIPVQLQYGGSGTLLNNLQLAGRGDLYIAADRSYIDLAIEKQVVDETFPLARMRPVIAVAAGNPLQIRGLHDLLRPELRLGLANPDAASIGKLARRLLQEEGLWDSLKPLVDVFKPTVSDIANDVILGAVDATIVWDVVVKQNSNRLELIRVPDFDAAVQEVTLGVLHCSPHPTEALRWARYLQAPEKGQQNFAAHQYERVAGDPWAVVPELTVYSGGVNRMAIQQTLADFEQREGVRINAVYNGCGILVSQIKSGAQPDAYFACDRSFMEDVEQLFPQPLDVAETKMVIAVPRDSPQGIESLQDLVRSGLRVGVAHPQQSALGALTQNLLESIPHEDTDLYQALQPNIVVQTPTADLLVNQLRAGGLDAAIVYRANLSQVEESVASLSIPHAAAIAVQPLAIHRSTPYRQLAQRLQTALLSDVSRRQFETVGFRWRATTTAFE